MTDEELATLRAWAAERRALTPDERAQYPTPDTANDSISGALYWIITTYWQDKPAVLVAAVAIFIWQIGVFTAAPFL